MKHRKKEFTVWYGEADTPIPQGEVELTDNVGCLIGVAPAVAGIEVVVLYRINSGEIQRTEASWFGHDVEEDSFRFRVNFPELDEGVTVQYGITCKCQEQVITESDEGNLPLSFVVVPRTVRSGDSSTEAVRQQRSRLVHFATLAAETGQAGESWQKDSRTRVSDDQLQSKEPAELPNASIKNVAQVAGFEDADELVTALSAHGVATLADVRKTGGLHRLQDFSLDADDPVVMQLEAHARLILLTEDLSVNNSLIKLGMKSIAAIAETPPGVFLKATDGLLENKTALRLQSEALKKNAFLDNVGTFEMAEAANGLRRSLQLKGQQQPDVCQCRDCEAAVSPLAYLSDLLAYVALKWRVWLGNQPLDLDWVRDHFHQPFQELPASCEMVEQKVRQVRICVEVLRRHLEADGLALPELDERAYLRDTYLRILSSLGVSYDELRLVRNSHPPYGRVSVESIAERVGIAANRVDALFFDLTADPFPLNEEILEDVFGLVATRRNDGTLPNPLRPRQVSKIEQWRLAYLKTLWGRQDYAGLPSAARGRPIIDPDVIGPSDIRLHTLQGAAALDMWIQRRAVVDAILVALEGTQFSQLANVFGGHDLDTLHRRLADDARREATITTIQENLHLDVDSFVRLMELRRQHTTPGQNPLQDEDWQDVASILTQAKKGKLYQDWIIEENNDGITLTPDTFWIPTVEPLEGQWPPRLPAGVNVLIDPDEVSQEDLPDEPFGTQMRQLWRDRKDALDQLVTNLRDEHVQAIDDGDNWFQDIVLQAVFGQAFVDDFQAHVDILNQNLPDNHAQLVATRNALRANFLTDEDFRRIVEVHLKDASGNPAVSTAEWEEVYFILSRVQRHQNLDWSTEEGPGHLNVQYWQAFRARLPKWRASYEQRQLWQQELVANAAVPIIEPDLLFDNAGSHLGDFQTPTANNGNRAYQLFVNRRKKVGDLIDAFRNGRQAAGDQLIWLNSQTMHLMGINLGDLQRLYNDRDAGVDISSRLEQLYLSNPAFSYLLRIGTLVDGGQNVLDSEWEEVYAILTQVEKRLFFYAEWRNTERQDGILLSPEFFRIPESPPLQIPFPEPPQLPMWRASRRARRDWVDMLEARIDQQRAIRNAIQEANSDVEEEMLPKLRDALIDASDAQGTTRQQKAKRLADRLLIDMQADGCHFVTRVSQAIETMQLFLWSIRTGQLTDTFPNLKLHNVDTFDIEWKWLGSYAHWRSAMFVFIYPENILYPTLRRPSSVSQGFSHLVQSLRLDRRLGPNGILQLAQNYAQYYQDVTNLEVEASCHAGTRTYWYGRVANGHCYWSYFENDKDNPDFGQSTWFQIKSLSGEAKTLQLLGAVPFGGDADDRPDSILVFAKQRQLEEYRLVVASHNLGDGSWTSEDEPEMLELPDGVVRFSAVVKQIRSISEPPSLVIKDDDTGDLYEERFLNVDGTDWDDGEWTVPPNFLNAGGGGEIVLKSMIPADRTQTSAGTFCFFEEIGYFNTTHTRLGIAIRGNATSWFLNDFNQSEARWLGAFLWPRDSTDRIFAVAYQDSALSLVEVNPSTGDTIQHSAPLSSTMWSHWAPMHAIDKLAIDSGQPTDNNRLTLAERRRSFGHWVAGSVSVQGGALRINSPSPNNLQDWMIVPADQAPAPLLPATSGIKQGPRRDYTETFFDLGSPERGRNPWVTVPHVIMEYTKEYYYYVPLFVALELQRRGYYTEALDWFRVVYDYTEPNEKDAHGRHLRKVWYGLQDEEMPDHTLYERSDDWLQDPLNPHSIASTRPNAFTRYTIQSLVRCFLGYADAEFTRDNAETVPRARTLYETALELLDLDVLKQKLDNCAEKIAEIEITIGRAKEIVVDIDIGFDAGAFEEDLETFLDPRLGDPRIVEDIHRLTDPLRGNGAHASEAAVAILRGIRKTMDRAIANPPAERTFGAVVENRNARRDAVHTALMANDAIADVVRHFGGNGQAVGMVDDLAVGGDGSDSGLVFSRLLWGPGMRPHLETETVPAPSFEFCIPPNPILFALRLHAELNLYKLRHCRNIAGMEREVDPYAAATDTISGLPTIGPGGQLVLPGSLSLRPTPYRYSFLADRAKQLTQLAQQVENAMLSALQQRDQEFFNLLKARQELRLARAGVRLQNLRVREAEHGVKLAELQKDRSVIQVEHYAALIEEGLLGIEKTAIGFMVATAALQAAAGGLYVAAAAATTAPTDRTATRLSRTASASSAFASSTSTIASIINTYASYERRAQEWDFQKSLSEQDLLIGDQQILLAEDRVRIISQERRIAEMQTDNAETVIDFLSNKFTNAHLYEWMSGILEGVYSFFLQQATAVAKLAETQLAFERQEAPPPFIQDDYWESPSDFVSSSDRDGKPPDRRGLTGSARLLQDIYQLDQYAFENDQRKLQLSKTLSLGNVSPVEFQRFRASGVLPFRTTLEMFDRDFPGHYLRLIKRVRVSVLALTPPVQGIHATLSTTGTSRVVIGGYIYQEVVRNYGPQSVALTSPSNATGLFDLQQEPEKLLPFEGMGVDTAWEFRMPRAANLFDFDSIADVLVTLEYTAVESFDYRQRVIADLDGRFSGDRPFSFKYHFADEWYHLHNPAFGSSVNSLSFTTQRGDFPKNLDFLRIQHVALYFAGKDGSQIEVPLVTLHFTEASSPAALGGTAATTEGLISTRRGNAGGWAIMIGKSPIGQWQLTLPNDFQTRNLFDGNQLEDILLVITYRAETPAWPE